MEFNIFQVIAICLLPVTFAITVHEAAHTYAARYFGDLTAYAQGRVSLNPLRHIDPIGTVALPLTMLAVTKLFGGGFVFGWAKPVPVNFNNLRSPRRDMLWVAAAGPGANLLMAIFWVLVVKLAYFEFTGVLSLPMALMGAVGVVTNVSLMVINLLPLPPLDGGRIVISLLPRKQAMQFARIEPYGFFIIIALMLLHIDDERLLSYIIAPLFTLAIRLVSAPFGVSDVDLNTFIHILSR